ncbi:BMP family protein [Peribacillus sp. SCS-37]|uniref:BMP family lipoprotein n=1 Tax=Paraperibacillus esterisolvens TaxID=3115296 RepID=UPI0039059317
MKKSILLAIIGILLLACAGCGAKPKSGMADEPVRIGIMLSDAGLGDQSFSDLGFTGLEKARDELGISFDYKEIKDTKTYEQGLAELVKDGNDLVIGLGFSMQEAVEKTARKYPKQPFLIIDSVSELPNVYSVTFKEEEGSYLIGVLAGMKTKSDVVGFVGGMDVPLIKKFEKGFAEGVKAVNPKAQVLSEYAGTFDDVDKGSAIAGSMIKKKADYIYPAAGYTGVGVLKQAEKSGIYSFGVDTDQFFQAEKAVVSSMLKKVDVAIYERVKEFSKTGKLSGHKIQLGIKEDGVDIAPIRIVSLTPAETEKLEDLKKKLANQEIQIIQ